MSDSYTTLAPAANPLSGLQIYPHYLARPLALCFAFESRETQAIAGIFLELGLTLDTALMTPSEPLLAMIRLQWWVDVIEDTQISTAPLAERIQHFCASEPKRRERIIALIKYWQDASQAEDRDSRAGWHALWQFIGKSLAVDPDKAAVIGKFAMQSPQATGPALSKADFLTTFDLAILRKTARQDGHYWLYLLACLGLYRTSTQKINKDVPATPLLGWHILRWRAGWPPRH